MFLCSEITRRRRRRQFTILTVKYSEYPKI